MKTTTPTFKFTTIDEHPHVAAALAAVASARQQLAEATSRADDAATDLHQAEVQAARGTRDERRLRAASDTVVRSQSEVRIASTRLTEAEDAVTRIRHATCRTVEAELTDLHQAEIRALKAALELARRHSWAAFVLEEFSQQLFSGGVYRQLPGAPLPQIAWTREFGGRDGVLADTRFEAWKTHCGVPFPS